MSKNKKSHRSKKKNIWGTATCECVITKEADVVYELKNIAVSPGYQRKGYGKSLIDFLSSHYLDCRILYVGTGDCPSALSFYHKCGFKESHRI